ncbi:fumarylacetoacetate hydrolase family protein [Thermoleophilum album]|uniref:fumarylacetoacetate hydrolase family protein n=1 Tax=Thermoleophilum album TaxID=29539 RepID=UPI00237CBC6E|nr:fumarylacetoacetate hydrolase family protein [Thermoleophilum album]WDT93375.1 fumarylacetoacetate hydrolase family protein [Thermoleophilum album]
MRLVNYRDRQGCVRAGVLREGVVYRADVATETAGDDARPATVDDLVASGQLGAVHAGETVGRLDEVSLEPPILAPQKIVCIGLNYRSHAEEQGAEPPSQPTFFAKFRNALAAPGATVPLPRLSAKVDYEAEVAFVVGQRCRDVPEERALDHIAGYTLFNDLSARDLQFATPQWMPGKVFDGSAPMGPALVTPDEAGSHDAIDIELLLNGERMQAATTADLVHSIPALVAHLSALMTLEPGDVVATGTPAGVGSLRKPRVWLRPGDELIVRSRVLGELVTHIGAAD